MQYRSVHASTTMITIEYSPAEAPAAPVRRAWSPGPSRACLGAGVVHVWRAELSAVTDDVLRWLSSEERVRAAGSARPGAGRLWALARGVLRDLLARYLDVESGAIGLRVDRTGKPAVAMPGPTPRLSFSLSHSGGLALYAFSEQVAVGVDVQVAPRRRINTTAIAKRAFGADEARRLAQLPPARRELEFLRAWTRFEAALKCHGSLPGAAPSAQPWVAQLEVGHAATGAVALGSAPARLCCWRWTDRAASGGD
jgi:4'-phosphopantetheinyl transferase